MHLRVEPRFTTEISIILQRLRCDTHLLRARILDVSGVGFRLFVQDALTAGEPLRILTGDYKLLVTVRYTVPVENGYAVGVERIDAWLRDDKAVPSAKQDAAPLSGRPQLRGLAGLMGSAALPDLSAQQTPLKGSNRPLPRGLASAPSAFKD